MATCRAGSGVAGSGRAGRDDASDAQKQTAQCWLPQVLHAVAANRTTQELVDAAGRYGASACPARSPTETLASLGGEHHPGHTAALPRPWHVHPVGGGKPPPRPEGGTGDRACHWPECVSSNRPAGSRAHWSGSCCNTWEPR